MEVSQVVRDHPEVFGIHEENHIDSNSVAIIAAAVSKGSDQQKEHFRLRDTYTAVCKLIDLGFRKYAAPLGETLFADLLQAQWYSQAYDLCTNLMMHHYMVGSAESARYYEEFIPKLGAVLEIESKTKINYLRMSSAHRTGQEVDIAATLKLVEDLKEQLPIDSVWYHFYYYKLRAFVCKGPELESLYLEAINYYENLYFDHSSMKGIFVKLLVKHYRSADDYDTAMVVVGQQLKATAEGSTPWYRFMMLTVELHRDLLQYNAAILAADTAMNHATYSAQPADRHVEWEALVADLKSRKGKSIVIDDPTGV